MSRRFRFPKQRQSKTKQSPLFIVKVQRPLSSNVEDPPALVYNKDRSLTMQWPMDDAIKRIMGRELKVYWWAYMQGTVLHLDKPAEEQDW